MKTPSNEPELSVEYGRVYHVRGALDGDTFDGFAVPFCGDPQNGGVPAVAPVWAAIEYLRYQLQVLEIHPRGNVIDTRELNCFPIIRHWVVVDSVNLLYRKHGRVLLDKVFNDAFTIRRHSSTF